MKLKGQAYNFMWIFFGFIYFHQSTEFKIWGERGPGAGFITFAAGLIIIFCGLMLFIKEFSGKFWEGKILESPRLMEKILFILVGFSAMPVFL